MEMHGVLGSINSTLLQWKRFSLRSINLQCRERRLSFFFHWRSCLRFWWIASGLWALLPEQRKTRRTKIPLYTLQFDDYSLMRALIINRNTSMFAFCTMRHFPCWPRLMTMFAAKQTQTFLRSSFPLEASLSSSLHPIQRWCLPISLFSRTWRAAASGETTPCGYSWPLLLPPLWWWGMQHPAITSLIPVDCLWLMSLFGQPIDALLSLATRTTPKAIHEDPDLTESPWISLGAP